MWCSTRWSFQAPISSRLGPPTHRPNSGLSTPATTNTNGPSRRTHRFERALGNYPDKAFVTWLLDAIDNGLSIGYSGPRTPHIAPNLISAHCHPAVSDKELQKELQSGRILGPYKDRLPNLRCSGVGVVPKKGGQWRVIMHLSAPPGSSINDYISQTEYDPAPIHLGEWCTYGKGRLNSAFRMVPVRHQAWEFLGIYWRDHYYVDTCLPFGCHDTCCESAILHPAELGHIVLLLQSWFPQLLPILQVPETYCTARQ